jgi:hypothetical protein
MVGHICTPTGSLQAMYTSVTSQKMKTNSPPNQAGSTGIENHNPLKTQKLTLIKKMKGEFYK